MRWRRLLPTLLLLSAAAATWASDESRLEIELNGEPATAAVIRIDDDERGRAADLVWLGKHQFTRGESRGAPALRLRDDERGRLYERDDSGNETLIALSIDAGTTYGRHAQPQELHELSGAALAALRGLALHGWRDEFTAVLAEIDPRRCAVHVGLAEDQPLPRLRADLRWLTVEFAYGTENADLAPLAALTELRHLVFDGASAEIRDYAPLRAMTHLRSFGGGVRPEAIPTFPELPTVTRLDLQYDDETTDLSFVTKLPALRRAQFYASGAHDLSPLADLPDLESIQADGCAVDVLPIEGFGALRRLDLLGHRLTPDHIAAFAEAHPDCELIHSYTELFRANVAGVDGIEVWPSIHRAGDGHTRLFRSREAADIDAFVAAVQVDDPESGYYCKCYGEEYVVLLRGEEPVAGFVVHHASALRGHGVGWAGDARLTDASAEALCGWLSARGMPGQMARRREQQRREQAKLRGQQYVERTLGTKRAELLESTDDGALVAELLGAVAADPHERAVVLIRLWAASEEDPTRVGKRARRFLSRNTPPDVLRAAIDRLLEAEPDALLVARYLVSIDEQRDRLGEAWFDARRLAAARLLLAQPYARDHHAAIDALGELATPAAERLLLGLLPPVADDGATLATDDLPTAVAHDAVMTLVTFCDAAHLPRLRAVIDALARDPEWGEAVTQMYERELADRPEPPAPAPAADDRR